MPAAPSPRRRAARTVVASGHASASSRTSSSLSSSTPATPSTSATPAISAAPRRAARPSGRPKAQQAAETRALLIATARRLFAERGYARVSLSDVLAELGLTKGAIYHHFRDKQALFHAVVLDVQAGIAETAARAGARGGDPWQALEQVCRAFFRELRRPDAMRIVCQDAGVVLSWAECSEIDARHMLATLRRFIDSAADADLLPPLNRDALLRIVTGAIYNTVEWASHDDAARRIAAGQRTLLLMLRALKRR